MSPHFFQNRSKSILVICSFYSSTAYFRKKSFSNYQKVGALRALSIRVLLNTRTKTYFRSSLVGFSSILIPDLPFWRINFTACMGLLSGKWVSLHNVLAKFARNHSHPSLTTIGTRMQKLFSRNLDQNYTFNLVFINTLMPFPHGQAVGKIYLSKRAE